MQDLLERLRPSLMAPQILLMAHPTRSRGLTVSPDDQHDQRPRATARQRSGTDAGGNARRDTAPLGGRRARRAAALRAWREEYDRIAPPLRAKTEGHRAQACRQRQSECGRQQRAEHSERARAVGEEMRCGAGDPLWGWVRRCRGVLRALNVRRSTYRFQHPA